MTQISENWGHLSFTSVNAGTDGSTKIRLSLSSYSTEIYHCPKKAPKIGTMFLFLLDSAKALVTLTLEARERERERDQQTGKDTKSRKILSLHLTLCVLYCTDKV